ncbi:MAG: heme exporter protein CcmB [Pseudomonadota bacterium]
MSLSQVITRDLRLALRQKSDAATVVLFFVLTAALFPFAIGPEAEILIRIAPGVIWVTALLSVLLSLDRLFMADYEDGTLELMILKPLPLELTVFGKVVAHWLISGLPLIVACPLIGLLYGLPLEGLGVLLLALVLGTASLSLIGAIGAALTLGARRGGVLLPLLVLPINIPILIFGVAASDSGLSGDPVKGPLMILGAVLLGMLFLAPLAAAAALRQAME